MANKIERYKDIDPNGENSIMSKVTVTTAGNLSLADIPANGSYTLRLWVKAAVARTTIAYIGDTPFTMSVGTTWNVFTFHASATANSACEIYLPAGTYYIWHPMLEKSTKASDYRQAPEDVQASIDTAADNAVTEAKNYTNYALREYVTAEEMHSEIRQTQDEISLSVSSQITRSMTYAEIQANNALTSANSATDNKLLNYVTTTRHTSDFQILSDSVTSAVTATENLATYVDGDFYNQITSEYSTAITQTANNITSTVSQNYATISTVNGLATRVTTAESTISQQADEIALRVTKAGLVSEINASSGQITMSSNRFVINSTYFTLSANGSVTASNMTLTGGTIKSANYVAGTGGMQINLSTGAISTKSGNFSLSSSGVITAASVNLTGSLKTDTCDGYYTHIHDGVIEQFMNNKRVGYIIPVINSSTSATQFALLGSGNYDGVAIGAKFDSGIYTYYRMNIQDEYSRDGCRHHFVGTTKFDNLVTCSGGISLGQSYTSFSSDYGIKWNGNISLRYATTTVSGVDRNGIWLGNDSYNTCITASSGNIYLYGNPRITGELRFLNISANSYTTAMYYDHGNSAINVGNTSKGLYLKGSAIYANGSPVATTSDLRFKKRIKNLPKKYLQLIKAIKPVTFSYTSDIASSGRTHTGFIAQQVLESMNAVGIDTKEFAGFIDLHNDNSEYALRYEEFIPLLLAYIKDLEKQINKLRR